MCPTVVHQFYQTRVIDEFVLRGNTGVLKCLIPSFVADFVQVLEWISDDNESYSTLLSNDVVNYGKVLPTKNRCDCWKILKPEPVAPLSDIHIPVLDLFGCEILISYYLVDKLVLLNTSFPSGAAVLPD